MTESLKTALVTGAGSGIGAEITRQLSQSGFEVLLVGRTLSKLQSVASELPGSSVCYECDLSQDDQLKSLTDELVSPEKRRFKGLLQCLVNNAAIFYRKSFEECSLDTWSELYHTNLLGPVALTKAVLPLLKNCEGANIINISSNLGNKPIPDTSAYSALKAAMNNWTQCLALELGVYNIRVNAICPGAVDTPIHGEFHLNPDPKVKKAFDDLHPIKRMGEPHDIATAVEYLSSPKASWITGCLWTIDGGLGLTSA